MTRVFNMRHAPPGGYPGAVYIGRPSRDTAGPWGNPVALGHPCPRCPATHTRADIGPALACYEALLRARLAADRVFGGAFLALYGRDLVCFCAGRAGLGRDDALRCHGQVILRVLHELYAGADPTLPALVWGLGDRPVLWACTPQHDARTAALGVDGGVWWNVRPVGYARAEGGAWAWWAAGQTERAHGTAGTPDEARVIAWTHARGKYG